MEERVYFGSQFEVIQSIMVGKARGQGHGPKDWVSSAVREQTELTFAFLFSPGLQPMGWCCPHLWCGYPPLLIQWRSFLTDTSKGLSPKCFLTLPRWQTVLTAMGSILTLLPQSTCILNSTEFWHSVGVNWLWDTVYTINRGGCRLLAVITQISGGVPFMQNIYF